MKTNIRILLTVILIFNTISIFSQVNDDKVALSDFVKEHENFVENDAGEIDPINVKEINKIVKFLVEEKFTNLDHTRNIIWDSYETYVSPFSRWHKHTFIVQVKMENVERYKYVEVTYDPKSKEADTEYSWVEEKEDFFILEEETVEKNKDD
ncbi:MAG: hypothetical protein CMC88_00490 [Flavobacteriaceae bacterium]|nr:hypothetical protein [Flavobacteriaceae bacterium]|tara:strand:- start:8344 stop:8799 length:456 start_codon:yes stop_codon:yes gene_type:complete